MSNVERAHLRTASPAGGGDGETHLVEDIHERQRARGVRPRTRHVCTAWTQRRMLIADSRSALERQSRLMNLLPNVIHRVMDGPGDHGGDGGWAPVVAR